MIGLQLLLKGEGEHPIQTPSWSGPNGVSNIRPELFEERAVVVTQPSAGANVLSLGPGAYPDILVPTATISLSKAPSVAVLWVDLWVPPTAQPGLHKGRIVIGGAEVSLELQVLPQGMPKADIARLGAVNFGSLLKRRGEDPQAYLRWMQMAHAHYLSVEVLRPRPEISPAGKIDWQGWAKHVGPFVEGSAFTEKMGYRGPRAGQPITRWVLPHTDWWPVKAKAHLPRTPKRFSEALSQWERFADSQGWLTRPNATSWVLFVNSLDEPKTPEKLRALRAYEPLLADAKLIDRSRILFRVDGNFGQRIEGWSDARMADALEGVVDLWNLHGAPWTIPWDVVTQLQRKGERLMFYASNTSGEPGTPPLVVDSALAGARAWGWIVYRYGLDGALNWEVDYIEGCVSNPRCAPGGMMNLDATLIYRGEELFRAKHEPLPSMRLKMLRRGAQDAALLSLLARDAPDAARALAQRIVPRALGDGVPDYGPGFWPRSPLSYERARQAILQRLAKDPAPIAISKVRVEPEPSLVSAHFASRWRSRKFRVAVILATVLLLLGAAVLALRRTSP